MNQNVNVFILTHKQIDQEYDNELYKPLICGADSNNFNSDYLCDNNGENISHLNKYFSELTGEFWAWKNSNVDIIGFCHYRRWFVKNIFFTKLTKNDIINDLNEYDIILPKKRKFTKTFKDFIEDSEKLTNMEVLHDIEELIVKTIKKYSPEYSQYYDKLMDNNYIYANNMFICNKELADDYFSWLFMILNNLFEISNINEFEPKYDRICGYLSERLLNVYVFKNNLKIKEYDLYCNENRLPHLFLINCRFPKLNRLEYLIYFNMKKLIR